MDGFLIIDKKEGYTSRDIVNIIEEKLKTNKVGHAGTLDPIATGVLVIAVGKALKILEFVNSEDKEYIATAKLGIETDTLDITGNITKKKESYFFDSNKLSEVLNSFVGTYEQTVPKYSSVKVNGKRLYKYAREGIEVELPKREVEVSNIELLDYNHDEFTFKTTVSKGTYIRSLIRDIGEKIEIPCTMKSLRRTRQGLFNVEDAIDLDKVGNKKIKPIPIEKALKGIMFVPVDEELEKKVLNGAILDNVYAENIVGFKNNKDEVIALYEVYKKDITKIKPIKVLK